MIEKLMLCTVFAVSLCAAEQLKAPDAPFVKGNNYSVRKGLIIAAGKVYTLSA